MSRRGGAAVIAPACVLQVPDGARAARICVSYTESAGEAVARLL